MIRYIVGWFLSFLYRSYFCYWNGERWICVDPLEVVLRMLKRRIDFEAFGSIASSGSISYEDLEKLIDLTREVFDCPKLSPSQCLALINSFFAKLSKQNKLPNP